ncbi:hypothetical protein FAZ69_24755 [Trinickia terrae]|uniref:Teneurin NHL domain-containing protein n=1 Tax=Trinickia terrae TaxID=2571161 RepID=A0A4U1HNJ2_9BURK|nr:NHL repeat-containing protein [Trinickia terrae]TKC82919.1 hypothetical protein FAZ69_24755 [Trinickia terrae]
MTRLAATRLRQTTIASLCLFLAACGGSDNSQQATSHTISGTLSALDSGLSIKVLNNSADTLTLTANGSFSFATPVATNNAYAVTVGTQPLWQNCSVTNGSGTATADVTNVAISCAFPSALVVTWAGSTTSGSTNGTGTAASFNSPTHVALDASGNVYVGDWGNSLIRKITPAGVVSTLAGSAGVAGSADGTGTAATFNKPEGVAVDASGNVYVGDRSNNEIRVITPAGVVSTLAGSTTSGSANGTGSAASFNTPSGVAVDTSGNVYVADAFNNEIRKITSAGVVSTLAGSTTSGSTDGTGSAASFKTPYGVAVDSSGNVYVADTFNNEIRKITSAGVVSTLAGSTTSGSADGTGSAASFNHPYDVALDGSGNIYVADGGNNEIRKITPAGVVTTLAGSTTSGSADGTGTAASFNFPFGVAARSNGFVYVGDASNNEIRVITPAP